MIAGAACAGAGRAIRAADRRWLRRTSGQARPRQGPAAGADQAAPQHAPCARAPGRPRWQAPIRRRHIAPAQRLRPATPQPRHRPAKGPTTRQEELRGSALLCPIVANCLIVHCQSAFNPARTGEVDRAKRGGAEVQPDASSVSKLTRKQFKTKPAGRSHRPTNFGHAGLDPASIRRPALTSQKRKTPSNPISGGLRTQCHDGCRIKSGMTMRVGRSIGREVLGQPPGVSATLYQKTALPSPCRRGFSGGVCDHYAVLGNDVLFDMLAHHVHRGCKWA